MNPRDALHQQQMLMEACTHTDQQQYLQGVMQSINDKQQGPVILPGGVAPGKKEENKVDGHTVAVALSRLLGVAETFYVSADMTMVAEAASHGLDDTDQFSHDLWPTDHGFLLYQSGWVAKDVWGRDLVTNAMVWERRSYKGRPGTMVWEFSMLGDERDDMTQSMTPQEIADMTHELGSPLMLSGTRWISDEMRVGPPTWDTPEDYIDNLNPEVEKSFPTTLQAVKTVPSTVNGSRMIMSLLLLMEQKIAAKERHDLRPKNPKRARRMKVPGQVVIIRLRHEATQREPGMTNVEWSHRWLVRGHWRWQYVSPHYPLAVEVEPGKFRARIYIAPFVKGPDGLPFHVTDKVNALIR